MVGSNHSQLSEGKLIFQQCQTVLLQLEVVSSAAVCVRAHLGFLCPVLVPQYEKDKLDRAQRLSGREGVRRDLGTWGVRRDLGNCVPLACRGEG